MIKSYTYKYYFRPEYGSSNLLLEFFSGVENESFSKDLFGVMKEISPKIVDLKDVWINNEFVLTVESNLGLFTFSKDVWGFAFITAENNQECLMKINLMLQKSDLFEKILVDFNSYKLKVK